jgi:exonuclease III
MVSQQVQVLGQRKPDVVALQDVNGKAVSRSIEAFRLLGLPHVLHTRERQHKAVGELRLSDHRPLEAVFAPRRT